MCENIYFVLCAFLKCFTHVHITMCLTCFTGVVIFLVYQPNKPSTNVSPLAFGSRDDMVCGTDFAMCYSLSLYYK